MSKASRSNDFNQTAGTNVSPYFTAKTPTQRPARHKGRLYVSLSDDLEAYFGIGASPAFNAPGSVYDAYNGLVIEAKRVVACALIATEFGVTVGPKDLSFSRYAGCSSCPCSPGFVMSWELTSALAGTDLWLDAELGSASVALVVAAA